MKDALIAIIGFFGVILGFGFGFSVGLATHQVLFIIFYHSAPPYLSQWLAFSIMGFPPLFILLIIIRELKKGNYEKTFMVTLLLLVMIGAFSGVIIVTVGIPTFHSAVEFMNSLGSAVNPLCFLLLNDCTSQILLLLIINIKTLLNI